MRHQRSPLGQRLNCPLAERVDSIQRAQRSVSLAAAILIHVSTPAWAAEPPVTSLAFAPDGDSVVAGSQSGVQVLSWPDLAPTGTVDTELQHVNELVFAPDGSRLAVSGGAPGQVGTVEVFTWPQRELLWRARTHDDVIYGLGWRSDGSLLATASLDRLCKILDGDSGDVVTTIAGHSRGVTAVALLEDVIITAAIDQSVRVWDLQTGEPVRTLNNHTQPVLDLVVQPSGDETSLPMIASTGDDRTVRFWQPTIGRLVRFARLPSPVLCVEWSGDGNSIFAACRDGYLRKIDPIRVETTGEWPVFDGWVYSLAVHPGGREILVGGANGELKRVLVRE